MELEEEFDIQIPDDQAEKIKTVGEAIDYIEKAIKNKQRSDRTMTRRRVVITGLGTVNPLALNVPDYWRGLLAGRSGIAPITQFDTTAFKVQFGGEVKDFDPEPVIDARSRPPARPLRPVRPGRRRRGGQGQRARLREGRPVPLRRASSAAASAGSPSSRTAARTLHRPRGRAGSARSSSRR